MTQRSGRESIRERTAAPERRQARARRAASAASTWQLSHHVLARFGHFRRRSAVSAAVVARRPRCSFVPSRVMPRRSAIGEAVMTMSARQCRSLHRHDVADLATGWAATSASTRSTMSRRSAPWIRGLERPADQSMVRRRGARARAPSARRGRTRFDCQCRGAPMTRTSRTARSTRSPRGSRRTTPPRGHRRPPGAGARRRCRRSELARGARVQLAAWPRWRRRPTSPRSRHPRVLAASPRSRRPLELAASPRSQLPRALAASPRSGRPRARRQPPGLPRRTGSTACWRRDRRSSRRAPGL